MEGKDDNLSPQEWRRLKETCGERGTPFSSKEEQAVELKKIINALKKYIKKDLEEEIIKAAVIYGGWAQGEATRDSDVDMAFFRIQDPRYSSEDGEYIVQDCSEETGYFFDDSYGLLNWDDESEVREVLLGKNELMESDIIIVTPFKSAKKRILSINPSARVNK